VKVSYDKSGTVTATGTVSGTKSYTAPGYWLCWNTDSTGGRISSTELNANSYGETYVRNNYKYYTYMSSRTYSVSYSKDYSQDVAYSAKGTTTGSVKINVSLT
jgi:hypothetical protein